MTPDRPLDLEEFERWRTSAGRALDSARLQGDADFHDWSCFLAEQAAQLAVKGLLHGIGAGPRGHDLAQLCQSAGDAGMDIPQNVRETAERLGRHYIPARYPDAHVSGTPGSHYGPADSDAALRDADAMLGFVDNAWAALNG